MIMFHETFCVRSEKHKPVFHNVTARVRDAVSRSRAKDGLVTVFSQHTTCSVILQEESHDTTLDGTEFLMQDLLNALAKFTLHAATRVIIFIPDHSTSSMRSGTWARRAGGA